MTREELLGYCDSELGAIDALTGDILSLDQAGGAEFTRIELAAASALIHYLFVSVEKILGAILEFDGIGEARGESIQHQKLLKTAGELGIVPPDLFRPLSNMLAFRSEFINGGSGPADREAISPIVAELDGFRIAFAREIRDYLAEVETE